MVIKRDLWKSAISIIDIDNSCNCFYVGTLVSCSVLSNITNYKVSELLTFNFYNTFTLRSTNAVRSAPFNKPCASIAKSKACLANTVCCDSSADKIFETNL